MPNPVAATISVRAASREKALRRSRAAPRPGLMQRRRGEVNRPSAESCGRGRVLSCDGPATVGQMRSGLRRKELNVGLSGAAEVENPPSEERYDVAGAAGRHDLLAKSCVGVARDQLLRFLDSGLDRADVEMRRR